MLSLIFVLAASATHAQRRCVPPLSIDRTSVSVARRIADAYAELESSPPRQLKALDQILAAYRDAGGGRRLLARNVVLNLRPVLSALFEMLGRVDPSVRWAFAYTGAALRTSEIPPGPLASADEVSQDAHEIVRRELELYWRLHAPPIFADFKLAEVTSNGRVGELIVRVDTEFPLELKGGAPRLNLPDWIGDHPTVRVTVGSLQTSDISSGTIPVTLADGRLHGTGSLRVQYPAGHSAYTTPLYVNIELDERAVAREVVTAQRRP